MENRALCWGSSSAVYVAALEGLPFPVSPTALSSVSPHKLLPQTPARLCAPCSFREPCPPFLLEIEVRQSGDQSLVSPSLLGSCRQAGLLLMTTLGVVVASTDTPGLVPPA